jgi:hypothetical protein
MAAATFSHVAHDKSSANGQLLRDTKGLLAPVNPIARHAVRLMETACSAEADAGAEDGSELDVAPECRKTVEASSTATIACTRRIRVK